MTKELISLLNTSTILFVEDEIGIQEEIGEILCAIFKEVHIAKDGLHALSLYKQHKPDLILSDIKMPKLNGLMMIKQIRKTDETTAIAIISAHTDLDLMLLATELNLLKYIIKPITKNKLNEVFEKFLEKKSTAQVIALGDGYILDKHQSSIIFKDIHTSLTTKELNFLSLLLKKKSLISYDEIEYVLKLEVFSEHAVRQFIKKIRIKLPKNYIRNIQNQGYTINTPFI
ncbi:response regulator transcription factor [Sulfurimonas sp.]|uniref:response regulator transcription factor n=1 Tax=Sulfurimonas sp. TaxID=2022749 RepID=UPI002B4A18E4|nr:response regulator [Sulfurimonas sp.]